ncbi:glycoside hydrolase family 31 protein [Botryobasidium botryosum FD-172 SS1]|uniref:Probable alpha/beta-glucosidase agdC n=1 Tax=Botryobasidium botryosum (strain FD-172 SS1) TaxID=930990 RepID=A0A067MXY7_BOTB1|nr:glycoside hydrolase family 31 protein [Botryobasidium botryosum FD-172 SS1]
MRFFTIALIGAAILVAVAAQRVLRRKRLRPKLDDSPGYIAQNVHVSSHSLTADLVLAGQARNVYGPDLERLKLTVVYEESSRIHVKITDWDGKRYQVPESVFPRPTSSNTPSSEAAIQFRYNPSPFSFSIIRTGTDEVLFDTASYPLIFEPQYLRLKTSLPNNPNVYGLGEHTGSFRLPTADHTRTLWSRDSYNVPEGTNLYGCHPVYYEHRSTGTHGVFLLNSNGMDIKLREQKDKATLEYNVIGGVLDLYFLAGPTPADVARHVVMDIEVVLARISAFFGPADSPALDYVEVANVVKKYHEAGIPLETMWIDIDYMEDRIPFTNDSKYFPAEEVRRIIKWLHQNDQHFVMMVDPAVAFRPNKDYGTFDRGTNMGVFLRNPDGSLFKGIVWPGVTVYPGVLFNPVDQNAAAAAANGTANGTMHPTANGESHKSLVNRGDIPSTTHFRHIDPITLGKIHRIARQRQPVVAKPHAATDRLSKRSKIKTSPQARGKELAIRALVQMGMQARAAAMVATGFDIDGVWIDMNEPTSFCGFPCDDPEQAAKDMNVPPPRPAPPPVPGTPVPDFRRQFENLIELDEDTERMDALRMSQPDVVDDPAGVKLGTSTSLREPESASQDATPGYSQQTLFQLNYDHLPEPDIGYLNPPYAIGNVEKSLSDRTAHTNCIHQNGLTEYDTRPSSYFPLSGVYAKPGNLGTDNIYGHMMSIATRKAMLARRPGLKPFIITRSSFAGTGHHTGKWLGDNLSRWDHYRFSIAGMLDMASLFQIPMTGSDVGGFGSNSTAQLCARWATLGAFNPFYRNHNNLRTTSHEFYLWPEVAQAAKNGITMRYRLLDYIYTAFHQAHVDGSPVLNPLFFKYPQDESTFGIDLQFFYGDSILVSPVTEEDATSVEIYLPDDIFYDFLKYTPVRGHGEKIMLTDIDLTQIPVHIRGGAVIPLRQSSAMTTADLRKQDFEIVVAPDLNGNAYGALYLDDGVSLEPQATTDIKFSFSNGKLEVAGVFEYETPVKVQNVIFLNVEAGERAVLVDGKEVDQSRIRYDPETKAMVVTTAIALRGPFTIEVTV